jgi:hypothetical protein
MLRPGAPTVAVIVSLLVALLMPATAVRAQTEPPPVGTGSTNGPAAATPGAATSPGVVTSPAPLPAAPPPAPPAPLPALAADPGALPPLPPTEERPPIYKQAWFWAVIGVVSLTGVMIAYGVASQGPATPTTDLGNMRAF